MITRIDLEKFKCFDILRLPLSSLTVLSGANASGKSSVLQAFALLHQTMRENVWSNALLQVCSRCHRIVERSGTTFKVPLLTSDLLARLLQPSPRPSLRQKCGNSCIGSPGDAGPVQSCWGKKHNRGGEALPRSFHGSEGVVLGLIGYRESRVSKRADIPASSQGAGTYVLYVARESELPHTDPNSLFVACTGFGTTLRGVRWTKAHP